MVRVLSYFHQFSCVHLCQAGSDCSFLENIKNMCDSYDEHAKVSGSVPSFCVPDNVVAMDISFGVQVDIMCCDGKLL